MFSDAMKFHVFTLQFHLTKDLKWKMRVKSVLVNEKISMRLQNISNHNLKISMKIEGWILFTLKQFLFKKYFLELIY